MTKKNINVDKYFIKSSKWLNFCKHYRHYRHLNEVFRLFLLCYVLSQLRTKDVVQVLICQPEVKVLLQLWHLSYASSMRKGTNFIKLPQLYFDFEM